MMYTFDNTFQVSFLFRDGMIAFVKDDDGLPAIKPISDNAKLKKPNEMTSFTSSLDNALIQVWNIYKCLRFHLFKLINMFLFHYVLF